MIAATFDLALRGEERENLVEREAVAVAVPVNGVRAERVCGRPSKSVDTRLPSHLLENGKEFVAENGRALVDERFH